MKKILAAAVGTMLFALFPASTFAATLDPADVNSTPDPSNTTLGIFSVSGNTVTLNSASTWLDGAVNHASAVHDQFFACNSDFPAASSVQFQSQPMTDLVMTFCSALYNDSARTTPFVGGDLSTAYIHNGLSLASAYSGLATQKPHLVLVSYAVTSQFNYWVRSASTRVTVTVPAPTINTNPTVSLSNGVLTVSHGTWNNAGLPETRIYACSSAQSAITTETSTMPVTWGSCFELSSTQSFSSFTGSGLNLSTAYYRDGLNFLPYSSSAPFKNVFAVSSVQNGSSGSLYVRTASELYSTQVSVTPPSTPPGPSTADAIRPYNGPIISTPRTDPVSAGSAVKLAGNNLGSVSKASVAGIDASVKVLSDGEIEVTLPSSLKPGTYDLVITSSSGTLSIQSAIVISGSTTSPATSASIATPSTKRMSDDFAKVWVHDVAGAGKVQILLNGKEIAWVRTSDPDDSKIKGGYLVRTVSLQEGKNVIQVLVDGKQVRRTVYSN